MFEINWTLFWVLVGMGMIGAIGIIPYSLAVNRDRMQQAQSSLPMPVMLVVGILQNGLLLALAVWLGLAAAGATGLGAPVLSALLSGQSAGRALFQAVGVAVPAGLAAGVVLTLIESYFRPRLPQALREMERDVKPWQAVLASFYGGISEEIFLRLFAMSGFAWLLARVWQTNQGMPTDGAIWTANLLAALLFGIGHLPATRAITPLTRVVVVRGLLLNGLGALLFGYLYWRFGLFAAMLAHFTLDLVVHVFWPIWNASSGQALAGSGKAA